jgi:prepilin-type N-terminal cleavage/methylation domain-containing protein
MRAHRRDSGFTVVELLIALSIISLVMVVLFSALGYARLVLTSGQETRRQIDDIALLRRLLAEALTQITHADNGPSITGTEKTLIAVIAPPRLLSFLTPPVRFSLHPDPDATGLVAAWTSDSTPATAIDHRIIQPEGMVRFSYFKPSVGWLGSWNEPVRLPLAVRAVIERASAGTGHTELELPVRALTAAICATQPRVPSCGATR